MRRRSILLAALLVAVAVVIAAAVVLRLSGGEGGEGMPSGMPAVPVETAVAQQQSIEVTVGSVGTVEALERINVTAQTTGIVQRILFEEGQRVEEDEVLVELLAERESAALQAAQAELRDARRQVGRLEELVGRRLVPQSDVDEARARLETAQARVAESGAALNERRITAPFSGVVGLREVSPGSLVEPGDTITTLATVNRLKVRFSLPSDLLPRLSPGLDVNATVPGFVADFSGRITRIDNTVNPDTRSIALEAELPDSQRLKPGLFVNVEVVLERREGLIIPEAAVILEGDRAYVYTVDRQSRVNRQPVVVGERRPGTVEIREGLRSEDQVVTAGVQTVQAGMQVQILNADKAREKGQ